MSQERSPERSPRTIGSAQMARIRTVKPEFFRHSALYDLEIETGLPVRIAFAGLWTCCDRAGRFRWRPRELKLDCLPHDDVDFSRVLDALATRGFLVRYASPDGEEYGSVPSFSKHQVINNREADSILPEPEKNTVIQCDNPRVANACPTPLVQDKGEGKGREGERKIESPNGDSLLPSPAKSNRMNGKNYPPEFEDFWTSYPRRPTDTKAVGFKAWTKAIRKCGQTTDSLLDAAKAYRGFAEKTGHETKLVQTWVNSEGWTADYVAATSRVDGFEMSDADLQRKMKEMGF